MAPTDPKSKAPSKLIWLLALFVSLILESWLPASAMNFGSTSPGGIPATSVSLGNNISHYVDFYQVQTAQVDATHWAMTNNYDPTVLDMLDESGGIWDVRVFDNTYGLNGMAGWVICPGNATTGGTHPNRWCFGQELRYNLSYPGDFNTIDERRGMACHELGHTVGLRHPASGSSCMGNPPDFDTALTQHDRDHLTDAYG